MLGCKSHLVPLQCPSPAHPLLVEGSPVLLLLPSAVNDNVIFHPGTSNSFVWNVHISSKFGNAPELCVRARSSRLESAWLGLNTPTHTHTHTPLALPTLLDTLVQVGLVLDHGSSQFLTKTHQLGSTGSPESPYPLWRNNFDTIIFGSLRLYNVICFIQVKVFKKEGWKYQKKTMLDFPYTR